jgi:hypothetical protein
MSFFGKLFTRSITYLDTFCRDENYEDLLHVFGAIRVMPDEGDSFDIWRHAVIDLNTYNVTNGLQQKGNEFSIRSPFAQRCIEHMSQQLNRKLKPAVKKPADDSDDESWMDDNYVAPESPDQDLEENCELPVTDCDAGDSDTALPKKLPKTGLVFTKNNTETRDRFTVQLYRSGRGLDIHQMNGVGDYFRHVLWLKRTNRVVVTYRKESRMSSGGMAFFVLDATTGLVLHNDMIK